MTHDDITDRGDELGADGLKVLRGEVAALREQFIKTCDDSAKLREFRSQVSFVLNEVKTLRRNQIEYHQLNQQIWEVLTDLEQPFRKGDEKFKRDISSLKIQIGELHAHANKPSPLPSPLPSSKADRGPRDLLPLLMSGAALVLSVMSFLS